MKTDPYLKEVFKEPPLIAFRRQTNIKDILIKSKVPDPPRKNEPREQKGMQKCGRDCTACPFIKTGRKIKIKDNKDWNIKRKMNCMSYNVIYLIECDKDRCKERYVGETGCLLQFRLAEHCGYISNRVESQPTGAHFNQPGHSLANMKVTILEQVRKHDEDYRKERESYFIRKINTYYHC